MVLELRVPHLAKAFGREEFLIAFQHLVPKLIAYAMSFVIVGIFWVNHHGFFHALKKAMLNCCGTTTSCCSGCRWYPSPPLFSGNIRWAMLFGAVLLFAALAFTLMGYYAMFTTNLMHETIAQEARRFAMRRNYPGLALYGLSLVLASVSVWISWTIFFLVPLYYFMPRQVTDLIDGGE